MYNIHLSIKLVQIKIIISYHEKILHTLLRILLSKKFKENVCVQILIFYVNQTKIISKTLLLQYFFNIWLTKT